MADIGSFVRVKYRETPVTPTGNKISPNLYISTKKKVPFSPKAEIVREENLRYSDVLMWPLHTQKYQVQNEVVSSEQGYRDMYSPSMYIRVQEADRHIERKAKEERIMTTLEQNKKAWEDLHNDPVSANLHICI